MIEYNSPVFGQNHIAYIVKIVFFTLIFQLLFQNLHKQQRVNKTLS